MATASLLDPILSPLLNSLGSLLFIIIISFIVSLITVIVYKLTTDQILMKNLKEEINKLNKEARKNMQDQKKAMAIHKEAFSKQMTMVKHSLMSTFITILPILLLISWMNANLAYSPITEGQQFTASVLFDDYVGKAELIVPEGMAIVDKAVKDAGEKVDWRLSGKTGEYLLEWKVSGKSYLKDIVIGSKQKYSEPIKIINDGVVKQIQINYKLLKILNLSLFKLGWLGSYIVFAVIFSIILRKILKVY